MQVDTEDEAEVVMLKQGRDFLISCPTKVMASALNRKLSVAVPHAWAIKKKKGAVADRWDGRKYFAKTEGKVVITKYGFARRVKEALEEFDVKWFESVEGDIEIPYKELVQGVKLDPVQEDVCKVVLSNNVCSVQLGTGSGKTECIANIAACVLDQNPNARIAVMVPSLNLLTATYERLVARIPQLEEHIGMVGGGSKDTHCRVVVCTGATASCPSRVLKADKIKNWLNKVDTLIVDEAHHSRSKSWRKVIDLAPNVVRLWALSGKMTFIQEENEIVQMELEQLFGYPLYIGANKERQCPVQIRMYGNHGKSAVYTYREADLATALRDQTEVDFQWKDGGKMHTGLYRGPDSEGMPPDWMIKRGRDGKEVIDKSMFGIYCKDKRVRPPSHLISYHTVYDKCIVEDATRNKLLLDLALGCAARDELFIVSVKTNRHRYILFNKLKDAGMDVIELSGSMTGKQQNAAIERMRAGEVDGAVAQFRVISEGVDIPNLVHFIKGDFITGEQVLEQQKGRAQRKAKGKTRGYLHIPFDTHHPHLKSRSNKIKNFFLATGLEVAEIEV